MGGLRLTLLCLLILSLHSFPLDPSTAPNKCEATCRPEEECVFQNNNWACVCRQDLHVSGEWLLGLSKQGKRNEAWGLEKGRGQSQAPSNRHWEILRVIWATYYEASGFTRREGGDKPSFWTAVATSGCGVGIWLWFSLEYRRTILFSQQQLSHT